MIFVRYEISDRQRDVLALLNDDWGTTVGWLLVKMRPLSEEGLRRDLRKLAKCGLARSTDVDQNIWFEANSPSYNVAGRSR